jgi:RNA polymerase sigma-70 factor (family 1)
MRVYQSYNDEQLVPLLKTGDEPAFAEIYERYWDKLLAVATHRLGIEAEAKELVQNVFFNLWKKRAALHLKYSLSTYLATAIKYEVLNTLASKSRQQRYQSFHRQNMQVASNETQNLVDFNELQDRVAVLIHKLPQKCRLVFELRQQGLSQKEVASALQISEKTVESHMSNAVRQLKAGLSPLAALIFLSSLS